MSTGSIRHNIEITDSAEAERFIEALEEAERISEEGMERLTKRNNDNVLIYSGATGWTPSNHWSAPAEKAIWKLAAYEDTGLTPEQIQAQQAQLLETRLERNAQEANKNYYKRQLKESNQLTPEQIQNLQQEINRLKHHIDNHIKWNEAHTKARVEQAELIDKLVKDKDEQAGTIMRMEEGLRHAKADLQVAQNFSHPNGFKTIRKAINSIDALLGGKEDV